MEGACDATSGRGVGTQIFADGNKVISYHLDYVFEFIMNVLVKTFKG